MSLLQKTLKLLQSYNISIRKSLSQNFLIDFSLLERLLIYACVTEEDIVLEIGAGLGYLTKLLSEKCKKVIAIEIDRKLVNVLKKELIQTVQTKNIELIKGEF